MEKPLSYGTIPSQAFVDMLNCEVISGQTEYLPEATGLHLVGVDDETLGIGFCGFAKVVSIDGGPSEETAVSFTCPRATDEIEVTLRPREKQEFPTPIGHDSGVVMNTVIENILPKALADISSAVLGVCESCSVKAGVTTRLAAGENPYPDIDDLGQ